MTADLTTLLDAQAERPLPSAADACATALRERFGSSTVGILFYGAGLRQPISADTLLDFYAIVDDPRVALRNVFAGTAAMLLPPNVYLIEVPTRDGTRRAKVAVISTRAFLRGMTAFPSHLWGRFAQPVAIAYVRDGNASRLLNDALCAAVRTFIAETLPLMDGAFTARDLWLRGLTECYGAELRPELSRAPALVDGALAHYEAVTVAVLGQPASHGLYPAPPSDPQRAAERWARRRRWGKTTNLLRLMKAAFTFKGGLDYAVAKIARHTGVVVEISDNDRRHPLLAGIRVFLEARRRGGVR
jgi:hypothetical protein